MSREELLLSNQLCFLFYRANKAIMARYRPLLEELGLTYTQYIALLILWERGRAGIGELCSALTLDTGTVSPLIKRLEAKKLLRRTRDSGDPRKVVISLTKAGKSLEDGAAAIHGRLASCIGLEMEEYRQAMELVSGLLPRLEADARGADSLTRPILDRAR